jgi:hypothetical protein
MVTLFVRHSVSDYATWRSAYDGFAPQQKAGGVLAETVFRNVDDPNDVTVTHEFASAEAARAFLASPELRSAMSRAGVAGAPTVWIATKA